MCEETAPKTKKEREEMILSINEAIDLYEWFLEDALFNKDFEEVAFLRTQIQRAKRQKVALKNKAAFIVHPSEQTYWDMMGD